MRRRTDTHTHTDVTNIHVASSTTHAKCNKSYFCTNIRPSVTGIHSKQQQQRSSHKCCHRHLSTISCIYLSSISKQHTRQRALSCVAAPDPSERGFSLIRLRSSMLVLLFFHGSILYSLSCGDSTSLHLHSVKVFLEVERRVFGPPLSRQHTLQSV